MTTPRWVRNACQPIAVDDVVAYLAGVIETSSAAGNTYDVGGPEVLTYGGLLERTASVMRRRLIVVPVPVLSPRLSAYWVELVTDVPRDIVRPLMRGLQNEVVADDAAIRTLLPTDLSTYRSAIERTLEGHDDGASTADRAAAKLERLETSDGVSSGGRSVLH